jgi:hypothetical protein
MVGVDILDLLWEIWLVVGPLMHRVLLEQPLAKPRLPLPLAKALVQQPLLVLLVV